MSNPKLKVGDKAPDFTLKNQYNKDISLSSLKGKKVLLSFHPLAWTAVCAMQMKALELKQGELEKLKTVALGMSVDSVFSKQEWSRSLCLEKTDLLADFWPHGEVAKKYDLFLDNAGVSARANVLIDEKGNVEWIRVYEIGEIPDIEEVVRHLKKA
jgi:peroxiredoxin